MTMLTTVFIGAPTNANAAAINKTQKEATTWVNNQIGEYIDYDRAWGNQCVDLPLAYYSFLGEDNKGRSGDGYQYWTNYPKNGNYTQIAYKPGFVAQPGDIAVWGTSSSSSLGHVAIVDSANASYLYVIDIKGGQGYVVGPVRSVQTRAYVENPSKNFLGVIRPNFAAPPATRADDIGTNFYAAMRVIRDNTYVSTNGYTSSRTDNSQLFCFTRNSNGTYKINAAGTDRNLDVANYGNTEGSRIGFVTGGAGNTAQEWRIQKNNDGSYTLSPSCAQNLVLDLNMDNIATPLILWKPNGTSCQSFAIDRYVAPTDDIGTNFYATIQVGRNKVYVGTNGYTSTRANNSQLFYFTRNTNGTYKITASNTNYNLDAANFGNTAGTRVGFMTGGAGNTAQEWSIRKGSDGLYSLSPSCAPLLLLDLNTDNAASPLLLWTPNGTACQSFAIERYVAPADDIGTDFYATIQVGYNNAYIGINGYMTTRTDNSQLFYFTRNNNGTYRINAMGTDRNLDVSNFGSTEGTLVHFISGAAGNTAQEWRIQRSGDGYLLSPTCSPNLTLDLNTNDTTPLRLWNPNGSVCQLFSIIKTPMSDPEPAILSSISVAARPNKTLFEAGETIDLAGLSLLATYSDGSTKIITESFGYWPEVMNYAGRPQAITVAYEGQQTTFEVRFMVSCFPEAIDPPVS